MTTRYLDNEIDLNKGDIPKVVKAPLKTGFVIAWMPLPEQYKAGDKNDDRNE